MPRRAWQQHRKQYDQLRSDNTGCHPASVQWQVHGRLLLWRWRLSVAEVVEAVAVEVVKHSQPVEAGGNSGSCPP